MSPKSFPHVSLRDGVYQYQRRVPKAVLDRPHMWQLYFRGQALFRKSLGTSVYAEALAAASAVEIEFNGLVAAATGKLPTAPEPNRRPSRPLDAAALADVARSVRDRIVREWRGLIVKAEVDEAAADHLEWRVENAIAEQQRAGDRLSALAQPGAVRATALDLNASFGFHLSDRSTGFGELVRAVKDGFVQAREDVQVMLEGKSLPNASSSTLISAFSSELTPASSAPSFSEVASKHLEVSNFAQKTVQKAVRAHQRFIEVVGDKRIDTITRQDIHRFLDAVAGQEVGKSSGSARPVTRTTVQSYLTQISSRLAFAIDREMRDGPNPAADIHLKHWVSASDPSVVPEKRRFEIGELNAVFAHPWFTGCLSEAQCYLPGTHMLQDMRYWAPVLALHTGARAGELGGLKVADVTLVGAPHITIQPNQYRRIKKARSRIVPIMDALLELGFESYVERVRKSGSDRLFPDWECPQDRGASEDDELSRWANSKWIRAFNRTVISSVLKRDPRTTRSAVTFHSFRGAFKKLLIDSGDRTKANAVIGHLQDELDRRYLGHFDAEDLHAEFHAARFHRLVIPSRM